MKLIAVLALIIFFIASLFAFAMYAVVRARQGKDIFQTKYPTGPIRLRRRFFIMFLAVFVFTVALCGAIYAFTGDLVGSVVVCGSALLLFAVTIPFQLKSLPPIPDGGFPDAKTHLEWQNKLASTYPGSKMLLKLFLFTTMLYIVLAVLSAAVLVLKAFFR